MKKALFFAGLATASLLFAGCNKEADVKGLDGFPIEIILSDAQTRTTNAGMSTKWAEGDALSVFYAPAGETTYSVTKFDVTDPDNNVATGTVNLTAESNDWYLFYPYDSHLTTPANTGSGYMTVGGKTQTQKGNDNKEHLAGKNLPIVGVQKAVAASAKPNVPMHHVSSVVAVNVTNDTEEALTVQSVAFTAPDDIVGTYYINFAGEELAFKSSGATYVSATATLNVQNGTPIPKGESAKFFIAIKPFKAKVGDKLTLKITADAGVVEKPVTLEAAADFKAGFIKTLNVNYEAAAPVQTITVSDIAASITGSSASFSGKLEGAIVTFVSGPNAFIQDETGGILYYKNGHTFKAGDKLSGNVSGTGKDFNGLKEITDLTVETVTSDQPIPAAKEMTLAELDAAYDANVSVLVKLKGVTVNGAFVDRNATMTDGTETLALRDQKNGLTIGAGKYDIIGFPSYYNNKQFGVWTQEDIIVSADAPSFDVTPQQIEVKATDTSTQIQVTGNVAWTATPSEGAQVDKTEGTGAATITVTFPANTDTEHVKEYSVEVSTTVPGVTNDSFTVEITQAKAAELPSGTKFVKVTSTDGLTDGSYLIVNETANVAMKDAVDEVNAVVAVEIVNSEIVATNEMKAVAFTFTASNGAFQGANGKYLAHTGDKNTVNPSDTPSGNTVTFDAGNAIIKADQTYFIQYNKTSNQNRFRYYKNAQADGAVQLYKLSDGSVTPPAPVEPTLTVDPTSINVVAGNTVKIGVETNSTGARSFVSSNTGVATVADDGTVTGVAAGSATITVKVAATTSYTEKSVGVPVTVTAAQTGSHYGKVSAITSGKKYLILGGGQPYAMIPPSGTSGTRPSSAAVTINNGKIVSNTTTDAYAVTINKTDNVVSIILPNGKYLVYAGSSTNLKDSDTESDTWTVGEAVAGTFRLVVTSTASATAPRVLAFRGESKVFGAYGTGATNIFGVDYYDIDLYELGAEPTVIDEVKLSSIAVENPKTAFNINDTFTVGDNFKVTATYSDGSSKDVTSAANVTAPDLTTAGNKTVTVSYTEGEITKETSYEVTVSDPNPPSGDKVIIIDGSQLTSTATDKDTEKTYSGVPIVFSKGAKSQKVSNDAKNAFEGVTQTILIGKKDAYIYNKSAIPGKIKKFEMYVNGGASKKVTVGLNFSDTEISAYSATAANAYAATLENLDTVIDLTEYLSDNAKYFWYQVTNDNNSQIVFRIEYE